MVITVHSPDDRYELQLQGRFDANWADHVAKALETAIGAGHHQVDLDFAGVSYISSAGLRVLLKYSRQLKAARGALRVVRPIESVLVVLRLAGVAGILLATAAESQTPTEKARTDTAAPIRRWERDGVSFEAYGEAAPTLLEGHVLGRADLFPNGEFSPGQTQMLRCTTDVLAVGLGAFGARPEDLQDRFGETLAVAGMAVTLPTDGSSVPDYQMTEAELVPELHLLYGLTARGNLGRLIRFEAGRSQRGVVSLGELVESVLLDLQAPSAAFAIVAETASVVGAMLKRSPTLAGGQPILAFPAVRDWLSFTTEPTDERNVVLITGVAERSPEAGTAICLRPVGPGTEAHGHFHAAVFPYRPLPKGRLDLSDTVASLAGGASAQSVMHLLSDSREFEGLGQTDLMRGACWVGPLRMNANSSERASSV